MATVLPNLIDRWRGLRNGKRKYVGQIVLYGDGAKRTVIAEVYGWSLKQMRARKRAVERALKELHQG